jgi:hypothetical protein
VKILYGGAKSKRLQQNSGEEVLMKIIRFASKKSCPMLDSFYVYDANIT